MSNEINVEELGRLAKAATPGPWRWEFNATHKRLHLVGGRPQYDLTIMDFDRWGMGGAVATLRDTSEDGMNIMYRLCDRPDWIAPFAGRAHHAGWCSDVTHPDMRLIATANPSTILSLIDRMKKAEAELERERMRLAACGVVALADTPESAAKAREMRDEYRSASCDDVARRVDECMTLRAERDALAAKLAELEGQEPALFVQSSHISCAKYSPFLGRICQQPFDGIAQTPYYARPVPADQPVNARLLDALKGLMALSDHRVDLRDAAKAARSAIATAEAQQAEPVSDALQDMHDAGREVDRVMAEAAPKAVRLTHADIAKALASAGLKPEDYREDGEILPLVVAIESAALRKNGLALED